MPTAAPIETDAVVIGAGPVGLFQAFQLGLQGMRCHIVDALPHVGGQCSELYADKPIYDIPGLPFCTGQELIDRLQTQVKPFAPQLHLGHLVSSLSAQEDGHWSLSTDQGISFLARTVFIAAGVGAFVARSLSLPGYQELVGQQIFHAAPHARAFEGQHLVILGDTDTALEACQTWRQGPQAAASVRLLHRRDQFHADPKSVQNMKDACSENTMHFTVGQPTALIQSSSPAGSKLTGLEILNHKGEREVLKADALLMCLGISPKLGPIAQWGLAMERKQLSVDTESFATQAPGIYAVGDINTYPGKKKLILCGFHEATLAAFGAAARLYPERQTPLQYTTTSTHLHKLLGLA